MTIAHREKTKSAKNFYRDHYRRSITKVFYCGIIIILLAALVLYKALNQPEPDYYATSSDGALIPLASIPVTAK